MLSSFLFHLEEMEVRGKRGRVGGLIDVECFQLEDKNECLVAFEDD